jgi:hypothetical protein
MGLFSADTWDYTKLRDLVDTLTGATIRRRAQHVIVFDPATGNPLSFTSDGGGGVTVADPRLDRLVEIRDRLGEIFPSGSSSLITPPPIELSTTAKPLSATPLLCRSVQIQSVRPDGSDNSARIAIGSAERQTIYLSQLGTWGDTAPLGQELDLSQIYVRGLASGDFVSIVVRI